MVNYLILIMAALTFVPIVVGILLGLLRGSRRALLRLILVVVCVALAFALCGAVANKAIDMDVSVVVNGSESMTLGDFIAAKLGENFEGVTTYIIPLVQIIVKILSFLLLFLLFQFLTWLIIFPICKIFVKPRRVKDSHGNEKKKKHPLLGAAFGLVQGVVVALVLCVMVNGVATQGDGLFKIADGFAEISQSTSGEPQAMAEEDGGAAPDSGESNLDSVRAMLDEYKQSAFGKLYNSVGAKPFELVSQVKTENGKVTLSGQIKAFGGLVDIAKEFVKIKDLNFDNLYADGNIDKLLTIFNNVQDIRNELAADKEVKTTVDGLLGVLGDMVGFDFRRFDSIDLAKEAETFAKLSEYKDMDFSSMTPDEIKEEAKELLKDVADSDLLMEMLAEQNIDLGNGLDDKQREEIDSALDEMVAEGELDQELVDRLRDIFNLPKNNSGESNDDNN